MGWAYGRNMEGREIGYGVEAECDRPGCPELIDRGIDYVCGGEHDGGEHGCGRYFCGHHLLYDERAQLCEQCAEEAAHEPA